MVERDAAVRALKDSLGVFNPEYFKDIPHLSIRPLLTAFRFSIYGRGG